MEQCSYDLLQEPWIGAVDMEGQSVQLGLLGLFERAHALRGLDEPNPLVEASLLRILLALTHRIVDGPATGRDWRTMYQKEKFDPGAVQAYFARWENRFDLFHPQYPFLQTACLRNTDRDGNETTHGVQLLSLATAKGAMKTLFDHHLDAQELAFTPSEAARHMLAVQNFGLAGLNRKSAKPLGYQQSYNQANLVGGLFCTLQGRNMFETLALNTLLYSGDSPIPRTPEQGEDAPVWEWDTDQPEAGATTPRGYLHYLTARCRHVLLLPEERDHGIRVSRIHFAQGEFFSQVPEPFFPRRKNRDGQPQPVRPQPGRMLWRDSLALFGFTGTEDMRPAPVRQIGRIGRSRVPLASRYRCCAYALAYDQANPLAWRKESLSVPLELLDNEETVAFLQMAMQRGEEAGSLLYNATAQYLYACLPSGASCGKEDVYNTQVLDQFWSLLEAPFQTFLLALEHPDNGDQALFEWGQALRRTALAAFDRCVWQRYADQAKTYQAWVQARDALAYKSAKLVNKGDV